LIRQTDVFRRVSVHLQVVAAVAAEAEEEAQAVALLRLPVAVAEVLLQAVVVAVNNTTPFSVFRSAAGASSWVDPVRR
jgi:hypothetical protein